MLVPRRSALPDREEPSSVVQTMQFRLLKKEIMTLQRAKRVPNRIALRTAGFTAAEVKMANQCKRNKDNGMGY